MTLGTNVSLKTFFFSPTFYSKYILLQIYLFQACMVKPILTVGSSISEDLIRKRAHTSCSLKICYLHSNCTQMCASKHVLIHNTKWDFKNKTQDMTWLHVHH